MRDALAGSRVTTLTGGFEELLSFAKSRSDDKVAPIPATRAQAIKAAKSNPLNPPRAAPDPALTMQPPPRRVRPHARSSS